MRKNTAGFLVVLGWLSLANSSLCSFSPRYANQSYSCRCFPCIDGQLVRTGGDYADLHVKICELRLYVRDLDEHIAYIESIFSGDNSKAMEWFENTGNRIKQELTSKVKDQTDSKKMTSAIELYKWTQDTKQQIVAKKKQHMAFGAYNSLDGVSDKFNTKALRSAWKHLATTGSFAQIKACWEAVSDFVKDNNNVKFELLFKEDIADSRYVFDVEKDVAVAFLGVKDMTTMTHLLHFYFIRQCKEHCALAARFDMQAITNLIELYNTVNALPIEQAVEAIRDLISEFTGTLEDIDERADDHFVGWLKSKWAYMPFVVGIIIVKIVQCFGTQKQTSNHPFFMRHVLLDNTVK